MQAYKHYENTLDETDSATIAAKANLDAYKGEYRAAVQEFKKLEGQNVTLKKSTQNAANAFFAAQTKQNSAKGAFKETAAEIDQCNRQLALSRTSWMSTEEAIQTSQRNITSIDKQTKTAESIYRLAAPSVKDFDKSAAGLTTKLTLLQEKLRLQQKAVGEYEKALAAAKEQLQAAQQVNDPDKVRAKPPMRYRIQRLRSKRSSHALYQNMRTSLANLVNYDTRDGAPCRVQSRVRLDGCLPDMLIRKLQSNPLADRLPKAEGCSSYSAMVCQ